MDDTAIHEFFARPSQTFHRQYEAMRAVFVDGKSQRDVAETFGFEYHSLRQLIYEFRRSFESTEAATNPPFFKPFDDIDSN